MMDPSQSKELQNIDSLQQLRISLYGGKYNLFQIKLEIYLKYSYIFNYQCKVSF